MIGIPTTAGTGSEAQSYAVISDARTHMKMACGDPSAAVKIAILDPTLTTTAPPAVTAMAGCDAIAHDVETWVCTRRTGLSDMFAERAWGSMAESETYAHLEHLRLSHEATSSWSEGLLRYEVSP